MKSDASSLLARARTSNNDVIVLSEGNRYVQPWAQLCSDAERLARVLVATGVQPGMTVAIIGRTSLSLLRLVIATWLADACPMIVATEPAVAGEVNSIASETLRDLRRSQPSVLIADDALHSQLSPLSRTVLSMESLNSAKRGHAAVSSLSGSLPQPGLALKQRTSGTTAVPRVVAIPFPALVSCLNSMAVGMRLMPATDRFLSWLPLYHDMGLIGMYLLALYTGTSIVLQDVGEFARRPSSWHDAAAAESATIICAPNFAFEIAAKILENTGSQASLRSIRIALNGAEMVQSRTIERYLAAGRRFGLAAEIMMPVYGLAEATLGAVFHTPGARVRSREHGAGSAVEAACTSSFVSVGRPLPGVELRLDPPGIGTAEGSVGEVCLRGPSCATYYVDPSGGPLVPTFGPDGWLHTGDLGFVVDGELYVCGRKKDLIILAGRNIYPEPIEQLVGNIPGVRPGRVAAIPPEAHQRRDVGAPRQLLRIDAPDSLRE